MDVAQISRVRRFNRTVTQRVGALHNDYLAGQRTLGEARLLWEIGPDGCDVRELRSRLDLDSGYVSRLLRALEADGLVTMATGPDDRRVRRATLTAGGAAERARYDERSDELAWSMLAPLAAHERDRLVRAMGEVERLLTSALVTVAVVDPAEPGARHCLASYFAELDARFPAGFDPGRSLPADDDELRPPVGAFLVASLHGQPVGCGALKLPAGAPALIKRMWVDPSARGLGLGRRLLDELEGHAAAAGSTRTHLDTNATLVEAIAMYRSAGYREVPPFSDEPYADLWFEKRLDRR